MEYTMEIKTSSDALHKSSTVTLNEDGTYKVQHIFIEKSGKEFIVTYPRVKIKLDPKSSFYVADTHAIPAVRSIVLPENESDPHSALMKFEVNG